MLPIKPDLHIAIPGCRAGYVDEPAGDVGGAGVELGPLRRDLPRTESPKATRRVERSEWLDGGIPLEAIADEIALAGQPVRRVDIFNRCYGLSAGWGERGLREESWKT